MKSIFIYFLVLTFAGICILSCTKEEDIEADVGGTLDKYLHLPAVPFNYAQPLIPSFFDDQFVRIQNNTPPDNKITDWGATLGRVLFYDTRLSKTNTISCSSCHIQKFGFTDTAQFSKGFEGKPSKRHSMALVNATFYLSGRFFWDERAATLEEQVLMPVQDEVEMGMRLDTLVARLQATEFYPVLFKKAFGSRNISADGIAKAMAQFVRSMISYQSKYDDGRKLVTSREEDFPNFTPEENLGKRIFMTNKQVNCFGCHNTDVFVTDNPRNNGVSATNEDIGVFIHTNEPLDIGKFKAPSLKNVALRKRYMHDGSLGSLMEVLEHYNSGIQPNPTLDLHLKQMDKTPSRMNLSLIEREALKAFLETLTDEEIIQDEKYSSPFD